MSAARQAGPRVGLFGIGLDAYWPQFAGLEERLKGYTAQVERRLSECGAEVVNLGLIDTPKKRRTPATAFAKPTSISSFCTSPRMRSLRWCCRRSGAPGFR
jgi:hypothetical protein